MRNQGVGSWPARRARSCRDLVAVVHPDRQETFGSLSRRVDQLANALIGLGVRTGDRVAYLGGNHPAFVEVLFASASIGAVFVPLNTRLAAPEVAFMLQHSGARLLFTAMDTSVLGDDAVALFDDSPPVVIGTSAAASYDYEQLVSAGAGEQPDLPISHDDVAMIMYTSGTTGLPKGAMLTHGNLIWNTYNLLADLDVMTTEVTLVSAPLFHTAALSQTLLPTFLKGGTSVLASSFTPEGVFDLVAEHRVSYMFGVPTMFWAMAASPRWRDADLSSVRILHCGGAPVPEVLVRTFQARGLTFTQGYGLTESSPGVLLLRADEGLGRPTSAGQSCFFNDVRLSDADGGTPLPGQPGEVLVSGPTVMAGYWQQPDATAAAVPDGVWLHTGDVAVADDDGFVTIIDRLKDVFISGGENVYPAEVESVLSAHPAVADCAVIAVPHPQWGEVGRAIVVRRQGSLASAAELLRSLDGRIARYKIPHEVTFVASLPRSSTGKLLRQQIRLPDSGP